MTDSNLAKLLSRVENEASKNKEWYCMPKSEALTLVAIIEKQNEALEFYREALDAKSGVIEAVINGGEYVPLGTYASSALETVERIARGEK